MDASEKLVTQNSYLTVKVSEAEFRQAMNKGPESCVKISAQDFYYKVTDLQYNFEVKLLVDAVSEKEVFITTFADKNISPRLILNLIDGLFGLDNAV
jgi:hypothetical protein